MEPTDVGEPADAPVLWQQTFAPESASLRSARRGLTQAVEAAGVTGDVVDDALLVLGEIAGNAVRHARTEFTVTLRYDDGVLRIEVFDLDTRPPALLGLDTQSTSGRGLHIVVELADEWGWQTTDDSGGQAGKVVWAQLAVDPAAGGPPPDGEA